MDARPPADPPWLDTLRRSAPDEAWTRSARRPPPPPPPAHGRAGPVGRPTPQAPPVRRPQAGGTAPRRVGPPRPPPPDGRGQRIVRRLRIAVAVASALVLVVT
ncbi:MAG: hypothetical protein L0H64_18845, partial [Pseudonocardia sp.]|nr:hypothetical protein [Pseudonocardia sp.]